MTRSDRFVIILLSILLVAIMGASLCLGAIDVSPVTVLRALRGDPAVAAPVDGLYATMQSLIWQLRLPRTLLAAIAGAALAVSGAAMQALFRNPLAEPGLAGVSGGSALAVALLLAGTPILVPAGHLSVVSAGSLATVLDGLATWWLPLAIPVAALIGGLVAARLVMYSARVAGETDTRDLLLAGIAINAIAGAGIAWLCLRAESGALRNYLAWAYGDLGRADWPTLAIGLPLFMLAIGLPLRDARALDALLLGEAAAAHLGVGVEPLKRRLLYCAVLGAAATAAAAGPIGFIGLVAPHLVRRTRGGLHARLLPQAALTGAILLSLADLAGRRISQPTELPAGILTALLGGPFFLMLILSRRRHRS